MQAMFESLAMQSGTFVCLCGGGEGEMFHVVVQQPDMFTD